MRHAQSGRRSGHSRLGVVSTKSIQTSVAISTCDVCGRTLLRGERAEVYLSGGTRRSVCDLCTSRAVNGGWVREGTVPDYDQKDARVDRRRSLLSRLRPRRETSANRGSAPLDGDEPDRPAGSTAPWPERADRARPERSRPDRARPDRPRPVRARQPGREERHVRAIPTSAEHKVASAVQVFNSSEHLRTVAGVARSLGYPEVSVRPSAERPSAVNLVVSWELCWYRYEVDLSDEVPTVRLGGQGYELDELTPDERQPNATADERGVLSLTH